MVVCEGAQVAICLVGKAYSTTFAHYMDMAHVTGRFWFKRGLSGY